MHYFDTCISLIKLKPNYKLFYNFMIFFLLFSNNAVRPFPDIQSDFPQLLKMRGIGLGARIQDRGIARSELSGEDAEHTLGAPTTPAAAELGPAAPPLPRSSPSSRGQDSVTCHIPVSALHHGKESVHKAKHINIIRGSFQTSFGLFLLCFFFIFYFSH